jgi:hypothetical protein
MRHDAVYIRKSTDLQEEKSQIEGVQDYLDRNQITIPKEYWFEDTGSRHKSDLRDDMQRLRKLVELGHIGRVFCWKQNRIGTTDSDEWGSYRWLFRSNGSQIIETVSGKDLTAPDIGTKLTTMMDADASFRFQLELSQNVLRAKTSLAREGMAQSKWPPYGYDKCYTDSKGELLWTAHVLDSGRWLVTNPDGSTVERDKAPRKSKSDRIAYVPSLGKERIGLAKEVFRTFAEEAISERAIALRLNQAGRTHYGKPWIRTTILEMLRNPAYIGSVRFNNKTQAEFTKFDGEKLVTVENPGRKGKKKTKAGAPIIVENRHPPIIDRPTWDRVQAKLVNRRTRPQPPRRDTLWLRGVLVCAQCGKAMHTFTNPSKAKFGYICASYYRYNQTRSRLDFTGCTRNWISHVEAEKIVRKKIGDILDQSERTPELKSLQVLDLQQQMDKSRIRLVLKNGVIAYFEYLADLLRKVEGVKGEKAIIKRVQDLVGVRVGSGKETIDPDLQAELAESFGDVPAIRKAFIAFEEERVRVANKKLGELRAQFDQFVIAKAYSKTDRERQAIDANLTRLDLEVADWEGQAIPLDDKLAELRTRLAQRNEQIRTIGKALTGGNNLRKAEVVRNLF